MRPEVRRLGSPARAWHDFAFDGVTVQWTAASGTVYAYDYLDLVTIVKDCGWLVRSRFPRMIELFDDIELHVFTDCRGVAEDPVEAAVFARYEYLGVHLDFKTARQRHRITFFASGEGKVVF